MDKKDAAKAIQGLNPKNISGAIPQALDLVKQLKQISGNPKMVEAVGAGQLQGMFKHLAQLFSQKKKKKREEMSPEEQQFEDYIDGQVEGLQPEVDQQTNDNQTTEV